MDYTVEEIKDKYIKNSILHGDVNIDNKIANKSAKELIKLNKYLANNTEIAKKIIDVIITSDIVNAQIWISGLAIDIDYRRDFAINLLISLGNNKQIGILAMNARLRLADRQIVPIDKW